MLSWHDTNGSSGVLGKSVDGTVHGDASASLEGKTGCWDLAAVDVFSHARCIDGGSSRVNGESFPRGGEDGGAGGS